MGKMHALITIAVILIVYAAIYIYSKRDDEIRSFNVFNSCCNLKITYDELERYYRSCPNKWKLSSLSITYKAQTRKYNVGLKTYADYKKYQAMQKSLKEDTVRVLFLNEIKQDIETYLEKTHNEVEKEIDKIKLTMKKTAEGNQDIEATILSFSDFIERNGNNE